MSYSPPPPPPYNTPSSTPKPWYKKPLGITAIATGAILMMLGTMGTIGLIMLSFEDNSPSTFQPTSDNPRLNQLYNLCADGDMAACDDLYIESPLDSELELFGDTCGGRQPADTHTWCADDPASSSGSSGNWVLDEAMENVWSGMTRAERDEFCWTYYEIGPIRTYEMFVEGYRGPNTPQPDEFQRFFDGKCG